jgi:hypothetical protein
MWQNNGTACGGRACFNGECTGADCTNFTPANNCTGNGVTCDFRSNTCCVTLATTSSAVCVPGAGTACTPPAEADHCRYSCDCPGGYSCCGVLNTATYAGIIGCQQLSDNSSCVAPGPGYITAQLCQQDEECKNGQRCIDQLCLGLPASYAIFHFCGLQSQAPYNCTVYSAQ